MFRKKWMRPDIRNRVKGEGREKDSQVENIEYGKGHKMWQNLTGIGVILTLISIVFGYFMVRMGRYEIMLDRKVDENMCLQKNEAVKRDLNRGERSFDAINEKLEDQGKLLVQIDTTVKLILEREKLA